MLNDPKYDEMFKRLGSEDAAVRVLSIRDIIGIHDYAIEHYGGTYGLRDDDLLMSVVTAPFQTMFGTELYPSVFEKAAKYLFDFANYQIFLDGNKRTGLGVCDVFLQINGFRLSLSPESAYMLVMDIANHRYNDSSEVVQSLKDNVEFCEKLDPDAVFESFGLLR